MDRRSVGIIGHFGGTEKLLDGQTIKTKILYEELKTASQWNLICVDTYYKRKKPVKLFIDTIKCLTHTKDVIILLSRNGMTVYFPLLHICKKIFRTRIYHDVIGGNLFQYTKKKPHFVTYLNSFQRNWVETQGLKDQLRQQGVLNCEVIPNFKRLHIVETTKVNFQKPYKFCTFSRVMKEKGIEDAIHAIEAMNQQEKNCCQLDIYGEIDEDYRERFENVLQQVSSAVSYRGIVSYKKSAETIQQYDALLFPTYWDGEGFPGTIIDAFCAGLPVIATDWNCNREIIENEKNGLLYPNDNIKNLEDAILWMIQNQDKIPEMKRNCIETAKKYQPDQYIKYIIREIELYQ